ncbi:Hypothetical_protein [Hexamita inflata]|uniref:Hypothetical_protein n=1 Tax=Hexamita inflata TaxID=28002 RepID=A0AA86Q6I0_9EUKA|nr:Hypothetical protein HINF_LOCUS39808 [Hexamita inflata]
MLVIFNHVILGPPPMGFYTTVQGFKGQGYSKRVFSHFEYSDCLIYQDIQSNLMIIVQSFYKRNLISKDHCGIFQQKIKSLKKIENIEDILKQREQNLPAQQEQPKRSQSVKPHKGHIKDRRIEH